MRLVLHSFSLRRAPIGYVFELAARQGWEAVELSGWHLRPDRVDEDLAAAVALGRRHGVRVHCAGYNGDFMTANRVAREQSIRQVERLIGACAAHGVGLVNGWAGWTSSDWSDWRRVGSVIARPDDYARAAEAYLRLAGRATEGGVRIAVEVHPNTIHDTVDSLRRLLDMVPSPSVVATPDPANAWLLSAVDRDPTVLDGLAGRIGNFHVKNCHISDGVADFDVDTAGGIIDFRPWLTRLASLGLPPALCVEFCGDGDPHGPLSRAQTQVRAWLP